MSTTTALLELRRHYESLIAQSQYQGADASEMLRHIDALLVNELVQTQDLDVFQSQLAPQELPGLPTVSITAISDAVTPSIDSIPEADSPQGTTSDRTPRALQPAYEGLKRFEAIAQALQTTPGQDMTTDSLIRELFGNLSPSEQKSERKRLNTLLYKGEKEGLWKKGKLPSSYRISKTTAKTAPKPTTEVTAPTPQTSPPAQTSTTSSKAAAKSAARSGPLQLLPEFEGKNKLEAISKVLTDQAGQVLHQDSIIQLLYGELSPEVLKAESRKMRASLFQGVRKGLWQRAAKEPSSYLIKASNARKAKPTEASESLAPESSKPSATTKEPAAANPGRKPGRPKTESTPVSQPKQASRGREQVLSLPAEFEGLSKIDAVAKVLSDNSGTVMHIEDIIERFYGELSKEELKAEKDRMKDVMTRGVKRGLWSKVSGVPSSFVFNKSS